MSRVLAVVLLITGLTMLPTGARATMFSVLFIDADDVHSQGYTGQGVTVAVIDTGINYSHQGLIGGIAAGGMSWIGGEPVYDYGADPGPPGESHGTYMSLIITDASGVAPDAEILAIRVFGPFGCDLADVVLAINYVKQRRQQVDPSIRVINLSLGSLDYFGCSCDDDWPEMAEEVFNAASAGIVTFAATGNESVCGGICAPACVSAAVRVAADYDDDYGIVTYY